MCHENNWLFKISFHDYLDGETAYIQKNQNTVKRKHKNTIHICIKNC